MLDPQHKGFNVVLCSASLPRPGKAKAEPLYQRSLAIWEKAHGPDHPNVATGLNSRALLYDELGESAKVEPLFKRSLAITPNAILSRSMTSLHPLQSRHPLTIKHQG